MLRQILPDVSNLDDVVGLYLGDTRNPTAGTTWVLLNMVASIDGGTAVGGTSRALGDDDDLAVFQALRAVADVILVGAATVRGEAYGPANLDDRRRMARLAAGRAEYPRMAVVSASLDLDPDSTLFTGATARPLILTHDGAPGDRVDTLAQAADVIRAGSDAVDFGIGLGALAERELRVVLCEGGPTLNGQLASAGLIDEVNLTVSPLLLGGDSKRILSGPELDPPVPMRLNRLLAGERSLFARYLRG